VSIKSDKWIRREAAKGMIEPFESGQVKTNDKGERLISYGTSSYGYDVRCSDHFKIFTNINSAIVDPKNFSEHSFVCSTDAVF
jgi:dCTP deaminase